MCVSSGTKPRDTDERQGLKFVCCLGRCGFCSSGELGCCLQNLTGAMSFVRTEQIKVCLAQSWHEAKKC